MRDEGGGRSCFFVRPRNHEVLAVVSRSSDDAERLEEFKDEVLVRVSKSPTNTQNRNAIFGCIDIGRPTPHQIRHSMPHRMPCSWSVRALLDVAILVPRPQLLHDLLSAFAHSAARVPGLLLSKLREPDLTGAAAARRLA